MKILITGSRNATDPLQDAYVRDRISEVLAENGPPLPEDGPHVIVHGGARGVDAIASRAAKDWNDTIERAYPAQWSRLGKQAGPLRNQQMLNHEHHDVREHEHTDGPDYRCPYDYHGGGSIDVVLAFPEADSIGTWDMVERVVRARIPVRVFPL